MVEGKIYEIANGAIPFIRTNISGSSAKRFYDNGSPIFAKLQAGLKLELPLIFIWTTIKVDCTQAYLAKIFKISLTEFSERKYRIHSFNRESNLSVFLFHYFTKTSNEVVVNKISRSNNMVAASVLLFSIFHDWNN